MNFTEGVEPVKDTDGKVVGSVYYKQTGNLMELRYLLENPNPPIRFLGLPIAVGGVAATIKTEEGI